MVNGVLINQSIAEPPLSCPGRCHGPSRTACKAPNEQCGHEDHLRHARRGFARIAQDMSPQTLPDGASPEDTTMLKTYEFKISDQARAAPAVPLLGLPRSSSDTWPDPQLLAPCPPP
jgi:hypothetical protein